MLGEKCSIEIVINEVFLSKLTCRILLYTLYASCAEVSFFLEILLFLPTLYFENHKVFYHK